MAQNALNEYPLLDRVMKLQRDFLSQFTQVPPELVTAQENACLLVHEHSPSSHEEKQAVMVIIVLASSPPPLYARVEAMADDVTRDLIRQLRDANPRDPLTPLLAQAKVAIGIVMMRLATDVELTPEQAQTMRARGFNNDAEVTRNFSRLNAPALNAEYTRTKDALVARLDQIIGGTPPAPPAPRPPRF